jgi:hypothetical protein
MQVCNAVIIVHRLPAIRSGGISVISTPCHVQFLTPDSSQVLGCNFTYMSKSVNIEMDLESFFNKDKLF